MPNEHDEVPKRRKVRCADGRAWDVREVRMYGGKDRVLLFETGEGIRIIAQFPDGWHTLPDSELEKLCETP